MYKELYDQMKSEDSLPSYFTGEWDKDEKRFVREQDDNEYILKNDKLYDGLYDDEQ